MPTITYKDQPRELPPRIKHSHAMRLDEHGASLTAFKEKPVTVAITLACVLLGLPGKPSDHADDFADLTDLIAALAPLINDYVAKKAPAAGPSPSPEPGTPGA